MFVDGVEAELSSGCCCQCGLCAIGLFGITLNRVRDLIAPPTPTLVDWRHCGDADACVNRSSCVRARWPHTHACERTHAPLGVDGG